MPSFTSIYHGKLLKLIGPASKSWPYLILLGKRSLIRMRTDLYYYNNTQLKSKAAGI
jgi:hypothetical protein